MRREEYARASSEFKTRGRADARSSRARAGTSCGSVRPRRSLFSGGRCLRRTPSTHGPLLEHKERQKGQKRDRELDANRRTLSDSFARACAFSSPFSRSKARFVPLTKSRPCAHSALRPAQLLLSDPAKSSVRHRSPLLAPPSSAKRDALLTRRDCEHKRIQQRQQSAACEAIATRSRCEETVRHGRARCGCTRSSAGARAVGRTRRPRRMPSFAFFCRIRLAVPIVADVTMERRDFMRHDAVLLGWLVLPAPAARTSSRRCCAEESHLALDFLPGDPRRVAASSPQTRTHPASRGFDLRPAAVRPPPRSARRSLARSRLLPQAPFHSERDRRTANIAERRRVTREYSPSGILPSQRISFSPRLRIASAAGLPFSSLGGMHLGVTGMCELLDDQGAVRSQRMIADFCIDLTSGLRVWKRDAEAAARHARSGAADGDVQLPPGTYVLPLSMKVPNSDRL